MPLGHIATLLLGYVSSFLRAVSLVTHVMLSHNVVSHKLAEDARSWLQVHAAMYGEQSPMTGCTFLPWGRRSEYYSMYVFERSSDDLSPSGWASCRPENIHGCMEEWVLEHPNCQPHIHVCRLCSMQVHAGPHFQRSSGTGWPFESPEA